MSQIFFTADTHWGHDNILIHDERPFASIEEHDAELIRRWNEVVAKGDRVYHLGDFCWRKPARWLEILDQLNGQKYLIRGNHDGSGLNSEVESRFIWVKDLYLLKIKGDPDRERLQPKLDKMYIHLCHYSMRVWWQSGRGSWHLYGHSHGSLPEEHNSFSFDVGASCHGYRPISLDRVKELMAKKPRWEAKHHGEVRTEKTTP
jgi:calcineurin-like phosphoesterase family protein